MDGGVGQGHDITDMELDGIVASVIARKSKDIVLHGEEDGECAIPPRIGVVLLRICLSVVEGASIIQGTPSLKQEMA
jgi:hypothetical protein